MCLKAYTQLGAAESLLGAAESLRNLPATSDSV